MPAAGELASFAGSQAGPGPAKLLVRLYRDRAGDRVERRLVQFRVAPRRRRRRASNNSGSNIKGTRIDTLALPLLPRKRGRKAHPAQMSKIFLG
jgi:hypothetical protein